MKDKKIKKIINRREADLYNNSGGNLARPSQ
jgi:hypothetical protein